MIHHPVQAIPPKPGRRIKKVACKGIAYFSRSPDIVQMDSRADLSDEVQGLRLVRAFLSLPPEKRAEVMAFVEDLVRAHTQPDDGREVSPDR
ncbi:hypothetical protein ACFPFP_35120 [Bradyrhizobium sp. GCM10023182]|uniref:Transcriptional regulator n=2 Tax=Bradyrhizobium zhengyangense TaxID=2911009 RepID=A0ABS9LYW5_9BRAD|nr:MULTISPECIES: hypothetical protein [Bradyrhizobium]MCG2672168.1 hypothetical protein [Bradyrhizobium zhengyangense]